jgi:hypothetical protein
MRILMRGHVRNVTNKVGRTLILLGKAVEAPEPKPEPKKRTYKRRDVVAEPVVPVAEPPVEQEEKDVWPMYPHERDE